MALLQKGYLGATPLFRNQDWFQDGAFNIVNASSTATVTANATAHVKGAWEPLISSTSANASFIVVVVAGVGAGAANTATLIDLGIGASGVETAFASGIAVGGALAQAIGASTQGSPGVMFGFPIKVASGSRISARIQSVVTGGKTALVDVFVIDAGDYSTAPTAVDVLGTSTATSQGANFSGASGNWTPLPSTTTTAYRGVSLVLSCHNATIANLTDTFSVGVGASGSEIAFGDTRYSFTTAEATHIRQPFAYMFGRAIPSGSRLAVRHAIAANPERYGFTLIGIP
jgi:hypothetical protein